MLKKRIAILATIFEDQKDAREIGRRWRAAAETDPKLRDDIILLTGMLNTQPVNRVMNKPEIEPPDPYRLAYEAGRRDLGLQLLTLMNLTISDLNSLMEDDDA